MIISGMSVLGGDNSFSNTPHYIGIDEVKIQNAKYDEIKLSSSSEIDTSIIAEEWANDTVLHALFHDNILAGNIDYQIGVTTHFIIKRRKVNTMRWTKIFSIPVENLSENTFGEKYFTFEDITHRFATDYQYAIVPMQQNIEGIYTTLIMRSDYEGIVIVNLDNCYATILEAKVSVGNGVSNCGFITTLGRRYPISYKIGLSDYDTGTAQGFFAPHLTNSVCEYDFDNGVEYRDKLRRYLNDGKPKIIKYHDSVTKLVSTDGNITQDNSEHYKKDITFMNWTEIGDVESYDDLLSCGLINVND